MKWVAVLKSDQFVHRVVGLFDNELEAKTWIEIIMPTIGVGTRVSLRKHP